MIVCGDDDVSVDAAPDRCWVVVSLTVLADTQSRAAASGGVVTLHCASGLADVLLEALGLAPVWSDRQLSDDVS